MMMPQCVKGHMILLDWASVDLRALLRITFASIAAISRMPTNNVTMIYLFHAIYAQL